MNQPQNSRSRSEHDNNVDSLSNRFLVDVFFLFSCCFLFFSEFLEMSKGDFAYMQCPLSIHITNDFSDVILACCRPRTEQQLANHGVIHENEGRP